MTTAATADVGISQGWVAEGVWNGAVGIYWVISQAESRNDSLVESVVAPAWEAAVVLLEERLRPNLRRPVRVRGRPSRERSPDHGGGR